MSLSNCIAIVIDIHNYSHKKFWSIVFEKIGLSMSTNLKSSLQILDRMKEKRKSYQKGTEVKLNRVRKQYEKMNDMMNKQRKDIVSGATYGSGIALQSIVPSVVASIENKKKKDNKIECIWFGCDVKKHKSNRSKQCRYYTYKTKEAIEGVDQRIREVYPEHYGKFIVMLFIILSKSDYIIEGNFVISSR